jgi:hypothetical protein
VDAAKLGLHFNSAGPRFLPAGRLIAASLIQDRKLLVSKSTLDYGHIPRPRQQFPSMFWNQRGSALAFGQRFPHFSQRLYVLQDKLFGAKVVAGEHGRSEFFREFVWRRAHRDLNRKMGCSREHRRILLSALDWRRCSPGRPDV